ncbi:MAG: hypothetical protein HQ551_08545 [Desulfobacteraceae bacterium]|nr:hypothetical protein [Desulfobacteraceae bacterium]
MSKKQPTLLEKLQFRGTWWLPERPDNKVFGQLTFDPDDGILLEADGLLSSSDQAFGNVSFKPDIILGLSLEGKPCTLWRNFRQEIQLRSSGVHSQVFRYHFLFLGEQFASSDDLLFRFVSVRFTNLEAWVGWKPFDDQIGDPRKNKPRSLTMRRLRKLRFPVPCIDASISIAPHMTANQEFLSRQWTHFDVVRFTPKKRQHIDWFFDVVHHFSNLLCLFTHQTLFQIRLVGCTRSERMKQLGGKLIPNEIEIYGSQAHVAPVKQLAPPQIPFRFGHVRRQFRKALQQWFSNRAKYDSVYDLYFFSFYNTKLGVEFQFLSLVQATEALHRAIRPGKYLPEDKYQKYASVLAGALPKDTPPDLKAALKSRIKYGNEHSLRKRLLQMLGSLSADARGLICADYKQFVNRVVDTRNYLTHYDKSLKAAALDMIGMLGACYRLRRLLTIFLLKDIGLAEGVVCDVISSHKRFEIPESVKGEAQQRHGP